ncbi:DHH family phosphoesterase [Clostridium paraputrificum]|uniref:DHH family phosphoesterase n=1 Tax=Clostridium TaxID=1485 RepID=UPI003D341C98
MKRLKVLKPYLKPIALITLSVASCYKGYVAIGAIIFLVYLIDNFYTLNIYWKKESDMKQFTSSIDKSVSGNLCNLALPVALIKENGEIVWHNERFNDLKKGEELLGKNIVSIARGMNIDKVVRNEESSHQRLKYNSRLYDIHSTRIVRDKDVFILVYFNDISDLVGLDSTKESVVLIEVDNLNEALDTTEENNRPLVVAEVERMINAYAHKINAMIRKYDTNKYILSVQDKYIKEQIEEKFPILDEISTINKGNKLEVTLSMGIGRGGISPLENNNFATVAKELALGRGGDQVVVKDNEDIKFFGGNTKEIEKRTRVRARVVSHALKELIYESSKVYILGHKNPDMDCFGAAIALSSVIKQLGKECNIILNNDTNPIEYFLGKLAKDERYKGRFISLEEANKELDDETLIIVVDVHNKSYVSDVDIVERAKRKVIIDHHRRSPDIIGGALLNYIEVYASSTSEMITEIIQYIVDKPNLTTVEAEGLLAGIVMDTKGFSFKTGVRTFEAASFLRNMGADTIQVKKMFTDNLEDYLLIAETIKSAEVDNENHTAIAVCPNNVDTVIVAKAADEMLNISGILACFVLANINDDIYISGRSVGDINVQVVLEALGGGGHMNIAGAKLSGITIDEVIEKLKDSMTKHLRVGE